MKKAKKISIIVIGVLLLIGLMAVIFVYDPDNMVFGNNLRSSAFSWGIFGGEEYKSIEEAMPKVAEELGDNYEDMIFLHRTTTGNVEKIFMLDTMKKEGYESSQVRGYEFVINESGTYTYQGAKSRVFQYSNMERKHDWKTTVQADLCDSTNRGYKKIMNAKKIYGVLPAWGVSDIPEVEKMLVDGQTVDHVVEIPLEETTYYLWIINDLQTENDAKDIVISVGGE